MICLDCPAVGLTYSTALPGGQRSASISSVVAASLDLPHRLPAATTLNRVRSANTSCCHGSRLKFSSLIGLNRNRRGVTTNASDVNRHCAALGLALLKQTDGQCTVQAHLNRHHLAWVVIV